MTALHCWAPQWHYFTLVQDSRYSQKMSCVWAFQDAENHCTKNTKQVINKISISNLALIKKQITRFFQRELNLWRSDIRSQLSIVSIGHLTSLVVNLGEDYNKILRDRNKLFTNQIFRKLQALILRLFWFWTTTNSTSSPGCSVRKKCSLSKQKTKFVRDQLELNFYYWLDFYKLLKQNSESVALAKSTLNMSTTPTDRKLTSWLLALKHRGIDIRTIEKKKITS